MLGKRLKIMVNRELARMWVPLAGDRPRVAMQSNLATRGDNQSSPEKVDGAYCEREAHSAWANEGGSIYNLSGDH